MHSRRNVVAGLLAAVMAVVVVAVLLSGLGQSKATPVASAPAAVAQAPAQVADTDKVDADKVDADKVDADKKVGEQAAGDAEQSIVRPALYPAPKTMRYPSGIESSSDVRHDVSQPLREIAPRKAIKTDAGESEELESLVDPWQLKHKDGADPVIQRNFGRNAMPAPIGSFNGINSVAGCGGCQPPDTNGEIGLNYYVQTVNAAFQVFNRNGTSAYGPAAINTIWTGFTGFCETYNDGDPVVVYDQLADRFVVSQFAFQSSSAGPFYECVAVSSTGDPTGTWNRYAFLTDASSIFPDYPKLSVWGNSYLMTTVEFGSSFLGARAYALDRAAMLTGQPATFQRNAAALGGSVSRALPVDIDGPITPTVGTPAYFVALSSSNNSIQFYTFLVDWTTPANSVFSTGANVPVAAFTIPCPGSRSCVPQLGTTNKIDVLGNRPMFRAPYRPDNGGTILLNHSVEIPVTGGTGVGMRWYEIRNMDSSPTLYQQGTFAPDDTSRFMGSIAMDRLGNIAAGYSAGDATIRPQIRYAGRLPGDPLGTFGQGENTLFAGNLSQTSGSRWGDYSDLNLDPTDDCTFWYTTEYSNGGGAWGTRIGSFKFPACATGAPTPTSVPAGTNTPTSVPATSTPVPSTATSTPVPPTSTSTAAAATATNTAAAATATSTAAAATATSTVAAATATPCTISFTDVPTSNLFYGDIQFLACRSIVNGANGLFRPNANASRGEFAKITVLGFGIAAFTPTSGQTFSDVAPSSIFFGYIESAAHTGAITGFSDGTFRPNTNVTRVQVAVITQRVRSYALFTPTSATFNDVPASGFGYQAVETLAHNNIINGATCVGGSGLCFRPNDNIKRGELSKVVRRAIETAP